MGVKFSELHILPTEDVASDDYFAVLDVSQGLLTRTKLDHSSRSGAFGKGDEHKFGHVRLSDTYVTDIGGADDGIAASQVAVYNSYSQILQLCQTTWIGTSEDWENMPVEEMNNYTLVIFTDK